MAVLAEGLLLKFCLGNRSPIESWGGTPLPTAPRLQAGEGPMQRAPAEIQCLVSLSLSLMAEDSCSFLCDGCVCREES
jgi:hypothetical protein